MKKETIVWILALVLSVQGVQAASPIPGDSVVRQEIPVTHEVFLELLSSNPKEAEAALERIGTTWTLAYVAPILDILPFVDNDRMVLQLFGLLANKTGEEHGTSVNAWYRWWWAQNHQPIANYATYKQQLYRLVDPKFEAYFHPERKSLIRLDEVRWGGVRQDGIPPLRQPAMLLAKEATYLHDSNIVFGLEINGDFRAYPKRILAWHEMFTDVVGDVPVAGVYCTLCGSMILYETNVKGTTHQLGTSGFLYRSNKLMYDKDTQSLWSTIKGQPVIGPLVDQGITLDVRAVVTTTWGAWRRKHPETKVLSLETGHQRDYSEGEAYRAYFATDELMFNTPFVDKRLRNKKEVVALRFGQHEAPLAISTDFLYNRPVHHLEYGGVKAVVLTDYSGASRIYEVGDLMFKRWDRKERATDKNKERWMVTEEALISESGQRLERLPAHRVFWFGWLAAHPDTELVK